MIVKYLAQEHNAVPLPGLEPGPPDPESSALTIRPPRLPPIKTRSKYMRPARSAGVKTALENSGRANQIRGFPIAARCLSTS